MSYVETYLTTNVERDEWGWPTGLDEAARVWLQTAVKAALAAYGGVAHISHVERYVFRQADLPAALKRAVVIDWRYACVHRALLSAGAESVWRLP